MLDAQVHAREVRKRLWQPDHVVREERDVRRVSDELERVRAELRATQQNLATAHLTIQEQAEQLLLAKPPRPDSEPIDMIAGYAKHNTIKGAITAVSEHLGMPIRDIISPYRTKRCVYARWLCFYIAKNVTGLPLAVIGRRMGLDHTTVLHGLKGIEAKLSTDETVLADINAIKARLA